MIASMKCLHVSALPSGPLTAEFLQSFNETTRNLLQVTSVH